MKYIEVTYEVHGSSWGINKKLSELLSIDLMSFDIETKGVYSKIQRKEALSLLDEDMEMYHHKLVSVVANNNGLSFPAITSTTHFIFGLSENYSVIFITQYPHEELLVWNWLKKYRGKLLVHNSLFDLKVMYHRVKSFPYDYEDTALLLKTLINNSDSWRAKVGLKEAMGEYYHPAWALFDEYEPDDLKDPKFLMYAAIDGAATYKLWHDMQIHILGDVWTDESERDFK